MNKREWSYEFRLFFCGLENFNIFTTTDSPLFCFMFLSLFIPNPISLTDTLLFYKFYETIDPFCTAFFLAMQCVHLYICCLPLPIINIRIPMDRQNDEAIPSRILHRWTT